MPADHPRASGEHEAGWTVHGVEKGPSPRERGAPVAGAAGRVGEGTIPARAGSTAPMTPPRSPARDHPRASGEHATAMFDSMLIAGPSPRERGAPGGGGLGPVGEGTIPARAGSTGIGRRPRSRGTDHPRASGEHHRYADTGRPRSGPSPRERGAPVRTAGRAAAAGTIPARAGSTHPGRKRRFRRGDHPRASGEHATVATGFRSITGPSPRERGARPGDEQGVPLLRTIPARAGSTRVIGDRVTDDEGPSPRERGARGRRWTLVPDRGTIPARAGSTSVGDPGAEIA